MSTIYENIAPYISNPKIIKEFLIKHNKFSKQDIIMEIEKEMEDINGFLKTDFHILLNEVEKHENFILIED